MPDPIRTRPTVLRTPLSTDSSQPTVARSGTTTRSAVADNYIGTTVSTANTSPSSTGTAGAGGPSYNPIGVRSVGDAVQPQLPREVKLGVNTVHRYDDPRVVPSHIARTVFVPLPTTEFPGQVLDLNAKTHDQILPSRCVIGDGGLTRCFIGVDKRPGTPLDRWLDKIIARMPQGADGPEPEAAIAWLRDNVNQVIRWTAGSRYNDGRAEFDWDKDIQVGPDTWQRFNDAASQAVGNAPLDAGQSFPVVPFEKYLDKGEGYCIQKALLATLVLEKLGIPCRFAQGAVSMGPGRTAGHSWVELQDGRVLDAAWGMLSQPGARNPVIPGEFMYGSSYRAENQSYPYLGLPG
ncbi:MAG: transglutaminase domain-containing protein [Pseudomonadota bacterium]